MDDLQEALTSFLTFLWTTIQTEFTSIWLPIQLAAILVAILIALGISALLRHQFDLRAATAKWPGYLRLIAGAILTNFTTLAFILAAMLEREVLRALDDPHTYLLRVAINLATAWVVIEIVASLIRNPFVNRLVAISTWTIAALSILGLLGRATNALDAAAISIGGLRISALLVLKTTALLLISLWIALIFSNFLDRRVRRLPGLTPSIQALIGNIIHFALLTFVALIVLGSVGIDLSALAWFSGAVGVGLGFGLQKIIANFISGVILLSDKSIKPGDVISVGDHFGWVSSMGARYTALDLKDGRELLVPNEDLITQRVINWSYTSNLMRLEIKFTTTYASDIHKTRSVAAAAAQDVEQVLKEPAPVCHLTGYGSAIEFVLWFWIRDANTGPTAVRSAVLMALWDAFEREGVAMPKPGAQHIVLDRPKQA